MLNSEYAQFWVSDHMIDFGCDLIFRGCVEQCEKTGCVGDRCFQHCKFSSDGKPIDGPWYMHEPLYLRWKQWDCRTDCRYHCMLAREEERTKLGEKPVKYHGKWPFRRVYGIQVLFMNLSYESFRGNSAKLVLVFDCSMVMLCMVSGTCGCFSVCP